jgi:hypothetical protein
MIILRKLFTLAWCAGLVIFCVIGFLHSGEQQGAQRMAWRAGYAVAGLGFLALGIWRLRRP